LGTSGTQTSELEDRVRRDPHEYQEGGKKYGRLQVALLVCTLPNLRAPALKKAAAWRIALKLRSGAAALC